MTAPAHIQRSPLVQHTSREAFRDRPLGNIDTQILAVIAAKGGACDHEIEAATSLKHQSVSSNRRHLVERGKVHASDETRLTPSGRKAVVWKLGKGPSLAPFIRPNMSNDQLELGGIR